MLTYSAFALDVKLGGLLGNNRVMRCLSQHYGDLLTALKTVTEDAPPEVEAVQAD